MRNTGEISNHRKGLINIIAATAGFSLIPVLAQMGLSPHMTAATLLFYRFGIAGVIFFLYCLIRGRRIQLAGSKEYLQVIGAGLIYSAQCIFFFSSFNYISSSIGEILYHCYPLFVLILAYFILHEKITKNKVLGVLLSITGVCIVLYAPWDMLQIRGIIYVVLTALISTVYMVYTKKFIADLDTTVLTMYLCLVCAVVYFIYAQINGEFALPDQPSIVINVLILAVCSTVIGFFCFNGAIASLSVGEVSILSLLEPIFTIVIAFLVLGVRLTVLQIVGTVIVLFAVYVYDRE